MRASKAEAIGILFAATLALSMGAEDEVSWPPALAGGEHFMRIEGPDLLETIGEIREGVSIARTPPVVTFHYYDCQSYEGKPWSVWGDGLVVGEHYYSAVGDHRSPDGNAFLYDYDGTTNELTMLADVRQVLRRPEGWYTPGKIHSSIGLGRDAWLYYSTHRGSTRVADDPANHFEGDWILRTHPETHRTEIVVHAPLAMQCLPTGLLDSERMIWYAGTADGLQVKGPQFLAYDVADRKTLYSDGVGPYRAMILAESTGMLYFHGGPGEDDEGHRSGEARLYRFDPRNPDPPRAIAARVGLRAATAETPDGLVYTIDRDRLWSFDVKSETAKALGSTAVATQDYTTSLDADPTGRYLYYIPGAHGGAERDGTPIVQYDTRTHTRKILCFLHPTVEKHTGYIPIGSFGYAVSEDGGRLFVTWNGAHEVRDRSGRVPFRSVAMTVVEIPESERLLD